MQILGPAPRCHQGALGWGPRICINYNFQVAATKTQTYLASPYLDFHENAEKVIPVPLREPTGDCGVS